MKPERESKQTRKRAPSAASTANYNSRTGTSSSQSRSKDVTIEAKIDVGFGNALYVRGEGHGLSWSQGVPLTCVDNSTWKWSGRADDQLKFKLLLNDNVWSQGEDLVAQPGEKVEVSPSF